MHIAVLMTNTDESPFAEQHPRDGEKFASLLRSVRPEWDMTTFRVKDGEFPPADVRFDGWIITGSPASVHDPAAWIPRLFALIRDLDARQSPVFGACFGHQAVAQALGGTVGDNPGGWVFGATDTMMEGRPIRLYAAHREQVLELPPHAEALGGNDACPIGSFRIGEHILTTQYHPEMTPAFVAALIDAFAHKLPDGVVDAARKSLDPVADTGRIAERIVAFFEDAHAKAASRSMAVT
jgi:GMP synthase-like glutamine amidotransferase